MLKIKDLRVSVEGKVVVKGLDLDIKKGEIVAIMGPNGSGKSTLANALMGHPSYTIEGSALLDGKNLLEMKPDERSKKGLFLSFQHPLEIPGVSVANFLRTALNAHREKPIKLSEFNKLVSEKMELLHMHKGFIDRYLNEGFSGGEKKKMEMLQLAILNPKIAILDETDSGLDIDALKNVCESINIVKKTNPEMSLVVITHYQRILNYLKPDKVCIMQDGKITRCGGAELAKELEEKGYNGDA